MTIACTAVHRGTGRERPSRHSLCIGGRAWVSFHVQLCIGGRNKVSFHVQLCMAGQAGIVTSGTVCASADTHGCPSMYSCASADGEGMSFWVQLCIGGRNRVSFPRAAVYGRTGRSRHSDTAAHRRAHQNVLPCTAVHGRTAGRCHFRHGCAWPDSEGTAGGRKGTGRGKESCQPSSDDWQLGR